MPADNPQDISGAISVLEAAIAALRERSEADQGTIAVLRKDFEQANGRADRAEAGRDAERTEPTSCAAVWMTSAASSPAPRPSWPPPRTKSRL